MKSHHLLIGYVAIGAAYYLYANSKSGSAPVTYVLTWPYQLLMGGR